MVQNEKELKEIYRDLDIYRLKARDLVSISGSGPAPQAMKLLLLKKFVDVNAKDVRKIYGWKEYIKMNLALDKLFVFKKL